MTSIQCGSDEFRFGIKQRLYNWHLRNARGELTQVTFAQKLGISAQVLGGLETLRFYPSNRVANIICQAIGLAREVVFPEWLRYFRLLDVRTTDVSISLREAAQRKLISTTSLLYEDEYNEINTRRLREQIDRALASLGDRQRAVIISRFGLDGNGAKTLEQVGKKFNVTRERIRAIEAKALRMLRHPRLSRMLKGYLD